MQERTAHYLTLEDLDTKPIERVEQEDGKIRYKSIRLLDPGKWTDSGSKETIWYSPEGIKNLEVTENARVNIMHDLDPDNGDPNEVSDIGYLDHESADTDSDGSKFADLVLDMDSPASEYADENLQAALESDGKVGFGGPSVEIPAEGQELEWDDEQGVYELKDGRIDGAALVFDPASKSVAFDQETQNRAVALSSSQESMYLKRASGGMDDDRLAELREQFNLSDDVDEATIKELAEAGALALEDKDGEEEEEEDVENEEDEEGDPDDDGDDETEQEEETEEVAMEEVVETVENLENRVSEIENMIENAAEQSELEDATDSLKSELADADTVEEIEARLSSLEDEPKGPKTMSDGDETTDGFDWSDPDDVQASYDPSTGSTSY